MTLPTYFISHGGGPWSFMTGPTRQSHATLEAALQDMPRQLNGTPNAVLMVSGHWEAADFTVMGTPHPGMIYDYGGFPAHTYQVHYRAPGAPALAQRVQALAQASGLHCGIDATRGFDHGAFAPLAAIYPAADVPVVQLSIRHDYDPQRHIAFGQALAPLRDEGVLIIGSGLSFHNLGLRGPVAVSASKAFDDWLAQTLLDTPPAQRAERLAHWAQAPAARLAHPQEDHLLPLMVALGAAFHDKATQVYHEDHFAGGWAVSSYRFDHAPA